MLYNSDTNFCNFINICFFINKSSLKNFEFDLENLRLYSKSLTLTN